MEFGVALGLEGRVALVTGASRGIGFAIARALHAQGVRVGIVARDAEALDKAAVSLSDGDDSVLAVPADVTSMDSVRDAVKEIHSWGGRLDIAVNCAGPRLAPAQLTETPDTVLASYLDVKLVGASVDEIANAAVFLASNLASYVTGQVLEVDGGLTKSAA